jgi:hypothetical protein
VSLYHVVAVNEKTGVITYLTVMPLPHPHACILLSKLTPHPARRLQLLEVHHG